MKAFNFGILTRLGILLGAAVTGFALIVGVLLLEQRTLTRVDHLEGIESVSAVGYGVLESYEALARQGRMSELDAKRQAVEMLRKIRYSDGQQFFIFDLDTRAVLDPSAPEHEGKSQAEVADGSGVRVAFELVKGAHANGDANVQHRGGLTGSASDGADTLSYAKLYAPWGWVIGTSVSLAEVDGYFWSAARHVAPWVAVGLIVLLAFGAWTVMGIARPVRMLAELNEVMAAIKRDGDLSRQVKVSGADEISATGRAFNALVGSLRFSMQAVQEQIGRVEQASAKVLRESATVRSSAAQQSDEAVSTSAGMEQLSASVTHIAEKTADTAMTAARARDEASAGEAQIQGLVDQMNRIADSVSGASRTIQALGVRSQEITHIVKTIKDIADQTNLLALNAAIEAARAGEQGRGFAVVADEVRKLAERSANATTEIGTMIDSIQEETARVVASMQTGGQLVQHGVGQVSKAGDAMVRIGEAVREIVGLADDVAAAVKQQSVGSQEIARSMERIAHMVESTDAAAGASHHQAEEMENTAAELRRAVGRFRC